MRRLLHQRPEEGQQTGDGGTGVSGRLRVPKLWQTAGMLPRPCVPQKGLLQRQGPPGRGGAGEAAD